MKRGAQALLEPAGPLFWTMPPCPPPLVQLDGEHLAECADRGRRINLRNGHVLPDQQILRHEITDHREDLRAGSAFDLPELLRDLPVDCPEVMVQFSSQRARVVLPDM